MISTQQKAIRRNLIRELSIIAVLIVKLGLQREPIRILLYYRGPVQPYNKYCL